MSTWEDRKDELARLIITEKLSFAQVGARMGFTRNAIAGACHRLGIGLSPAEVTRLRAERAAKRPVRRVRAPRLRTVAIPAELPAPDASQQVRLLDATINDCRYICGPISGFDTMVCGCDTVAGTSWCAFHYHHTHIPRRRD